MQEAFSAVVFGPAYLDVVLRVDAPLLDRAAFPRPLDRGILGRMVASGSEHHRDLVLRAPDGQIRVVLPSPGPLRGGTVEMDEALGDGLPFGTRDLTATGVVEDLGGMGAGYAKAFGGLLVSALGDEGNDPTTRRVSALLEEQGIRSWPICVPSRPADWTLLVTSGAHGDKLAVGFRGCHAALDGWGLIAGELRGADLLVAASLTNALARAALRSAAAGTVRMFAPTRFNLRDRDPSVASFADAIDVLCCNRQEWELLPEGERALLERRAKLLSVTDGPAGARIACGGVVIDVPAFPRAFPPRDTNRAGEAFAATLVGTLMGTGWRSGAGLARMDLESAAIRASAAAALVLDIEPFGFPSEPAIAAALRAGIVRG